MAFVLAAVGLSGLLVVSVLWGVPHVERDLETRADAALVEGGFENISVSVEGRELKLRGASARDIEPGLRATVADVDGIRDVEVRISRLERPLTQQGG